jgi:DNA invertase Pin-like site-specific DNA recombinase
LVNELETDGVHFQSITDTKTPAGRFFFHVMASLAQMERELARTRVRPSCLEAGMGKEVGEI